MTRKLTRSDILPLAEYGKERRQRRAEINEIKKKRRVEVGPFTTFYFECFETMWHQVHEMLWIEKGGEEQIADELAAYNPLIPDGDELVATVMIEIDDPVRRDRTLRQLGGIEKAFYLSFAGETIRGVADEDRENTRESDNKASSVQFVHFPFTAAQKQKFKSAGTQVVVGIDHPNYAHMAVMPEPVRQELTRDLE
ncbi:MAG: DUF3501 family protein [Rhodospirillales bacterium]|nr:DUF3501 family protein [Rhodospirillales bacterium]